MENMKLSFLIIALGFSFLFTANAQTDTLVITLKNKQVDKIAVSQIQKIKFENITAVDDQSSQIKVLYLFGNFPNPFADQTSIEFELEKSGFVEIIIYDINGKQIQKLECKNCPLGRRAIQWNCLDFNNKKVQNGLYFYEVRFENEIQSKKMILIK
jgi:hypothetical protein